MKQHELLLIAVAQKCMQLKTHNQRRKHRWWVNGIIKNRLQQGAYHNLVKNLQFDEEKFQQYFRLKREQFDQVLCYLEEDFAFWHSCLSERKHPTLTSYSRISQLPPSDFVPFCHMNRYMERISLTHMQPGLYFERKSMPYTQTILRTWGAYSRPPMPIYAVVIAQMASINTPATVPRRLFR